ncbi:SAM-dependent methyltransferase [Polycladomyces abyssicola]|uniref:SAM-dependent methyltransferase n=1 Tax=Polycladomyces abyssicola TaxID=1125966 RepID=A0A8D5UCK8_9BACL|nr:methyltransferase domain-containing protein [Polycladomyces abyssicola]BCU80981.1 SAM-dependent methyltransferase [Polycladomyces abyssicola]
MNNEKNRQIYRMWAPFYDWVLQNRWFRSARRKVVEQAHLQPGENVLLVGVGTGLDFAYLPESVRVTGIDLSPEMLEQARKKASRHVIHLQQMNAEALAFPDETFDAVFFNLILSVVEDPRKALMEGIRVLKGSGRILIFDKFRHSEASPSWVSQTLNILTRRLGTDVNRSFERIADGMPVYVVKDEPSLFRGKYRIIELRKD